MNKSLAVFGGEKIQTQTEYYPNEGIGRNLWCIRVEINTYFKVTLRRNLKECISCLCRHSYNIGILEEIVVERSQCFYAFPCESQSCCTICNLASLRGKNTALNGFADFTGASSNASSDKFISASCSFSFPSTTTGGGLISNAQIMFAKASVSAFSANREPGHILLPAPNVKWARA